MKNAASTSGEGNCWRHSLPVSRHFRRRLEENKHYEDQTVYLTNRIHQIFLNATKPWKAISYNTLLQILATQCQIQIVFHCPPTRPRHSQRLLTLLEVRGEAFSSKSPLLFQLSKLHYNTYNQHIENNHLTNGCGENRTVSNKSSKTTWYCGEI